MLHYAGMRSL